jgi:hypothetical protein
MSNRITIEPIHGMQGGTEKPCPACGVKYCLIDYAEATDHAVGKKYSFEIVNCDCGRILNKAEIRKMVPGIVFNAVFFGDEQTV